MTLTTVLLFSIGGPEVLFVFFAILLLFGAKKIPELARGLGRGIREFKDATKEVKGQIEEAGMKEEEKERANTPK